MLGSIGKLFLTVWNHSTHVFSPEGDELSVAYVETALEALVASIGKLKEELATRVLAAGVPTHAKQMIFARKIFLIFYSFRNS